MALTDTAIRKLRPTDKPFKLGDSSGLYLLIKPNGSKLSYMKSALTGKKRSWPLAPTRMFPCLRHASSAMRHAVKCVQGLIPPLTKKSHNRK